MTTSVRTTKERDVMVSRLASPCGRDASARRTGMLESGTMTQQMAHFRRTRAAGSFAAWDRGGAHAPVRKVVMKQIGRARRTDGLMSPFQGPSIVGDSKTLSSRDAQRAGVGASPRTAEHNGTSSQAGPGL